MGGVPVKKGNQRKHSRRNLILVLLLAALCVGAAELAACRHFEPELYEQITAPVRQAAAAASAACRRGLDSAGQLCVRLGEGASRLAEAASLRWAELTAPPEPSPGQEVDDQLASEPVLVDRDPVTDPAVTQLLVEEGRQILTGGFYDILYFCQGDDAWAGLPYGSDHIGGYGCGPTALAMAVASMTETETDPAAMAQWAVKRGCWARGSGSYHSIVLRAAQDFGLVGEAVSPGTPEELCEQLLSGKLLVALMGPGHFTKRGHFILQRGVTLRGEVLVADPNSRDRSLTVWDPQLILDELSSASDNGAPLWALSVPPAFS